jgi:quinol monooxygenase YgiN
MITAVGICRAKRGQEEELGRRMKELVPPTSVEPGCVRYDLYRSETDSAIWIFYEVWQSDAALDAHVQSTHFQAFLAKKDDVLDGSPNNYRLSLVMPSTSSR